MGAMIPADFPERNFVYTKPEGWLDEQCMGLPVWRGPLPIDDAGTMGHMIISKWRLSKEDLETVARTGEVWLSVTANGMPPVSVFTENPFTPIR